MPGKWSQSAIPAWSRPADGVIGPLRLVEASLQEDIGQTLRIAVDCLPLPAMASGRTGIRFQRLSEVAALDLSLGRLFEGHSDAVQILSEAGLATYEGVYGVWTAATNDLVARRDQDGWLLNGSKPYCSGASLLSRALVSASFTEGNLLFEVAAAETGLQRLPDTWPSTGMARSESYSLGFDDVPAARVVGPVDFYTNRPGFWQGSLNVAACWFGGALGLARGVLPRMAGNPDPHAWAAFGSLSSEIDMMQQVLRQAAAETDADPSDKEDRGQERAFSARYQIYHGAQRVADLAGRIGGTGGFTHDDAQSRRLADLFIYLRQYHPGRDEEWLGRRSFERHSNG